ncbi:MAG TPA: Rnf-Nqr domain containing protein [Candidatus Eisenbacteria bacterium]|nr:Rnf-Nqr domain containing protein [Candidatus Eisenbacteria bacterium]
MAREGRSLFAEVGHPMPWAAVALAAAVLLGILFGFPRQAHGGSVMPRIVSARVSSPDQVQLRLSGPLSRTDASNFRFTHARAPDIALPVRDVRLLPGNRVVLTIGRSLRSAESYRLEIREPPLARAVTPSTWTLLFSVLLSSALINNFVFTRYLGLCIFFGITRKRDAAVGMGITFTIVMVTTGMVSWLLYMFVLRPLQLSFLQILVFIGVVAFLVQMLDTVLKKTHAGLHKKFGIYLMLITTNCIILAVPLLNAAADAGPLESFALAMGSGLGFALALFLMSCAREKMELARVPASFEGLPIAFALAGLFALAFMGFSGLDFFR